MPDQMLIDLSRYRIERATEMLAAAKREADAEDYASANNRAYYCIFHAIRSVLALDGEGNIHLEVTVSLYASRILRTGAGRMILRLTALVLGGETINSPLAR